MCVWCERGGVCECESVCACASVEGERVCVRGVCVVCVCVCVCVGVRVCVCVCGVCVCVVARVFSLHHRADSGKSIVYDGMLTAVVFHCSSCTGCKHEVILTSYGGDPALQHTCHSNTLLHSSGYVFLPLRELKGEFV